MEVTLNRIEITWDDLNFESWEMSNLAEKIIDGATDDDLCDMVPHMFGEVSDTLRLANAFASEIRGALTEDEEQELLEELDISCPELNKHPDHLIQVMADEWPEWSDDVKRTFFSSLGLWRTEEIIKLLVPSLVPDVKDNPGSRVLYEVFILNAVRRAISDVEAITAHIERKIKEKQS